MATKKVAKIKSLADLKKIKDRVNKSIECENGTRIVVGLGTCGIAAGARPIYEAIEAELKASGKKDVLLEPTGCVGICQFEPVVEVYEPGGKRTTYVHMTPERATRIVKQHIIGGNPIAEFTIGSARKAR